MKKLFFLLLIPSIALAVPSPTPTATATATAKPKAAVMLNSADEVINATIKFGAWNTITGLTTVSATFSQFVQLTPIATPPPSATEGAVYADTDHHLYFYNGSTWLQLDNAP